MNRPYLKIAGLKNSFSGTGAGEKGFTVSEFLVAFCMMAVLMAAMIKLFSMLNQSYTTQNVAAGVQQVVRTGIDIMTHHIRMAGFNPMIIADVGFMDDISENRIHFSYDLNANGLVDKDEDITYLYEDQKLKRKTVDQDNPETFIDHVTDFKFTYLDIEDAVTTNPRDVKTVMISLTVTEPAGRSRPVSRTYSTRVICRNQGL